MGKGGAWGSPKSSETYGAGTVEGAPKVAAARPGKFAERVKPDPLGSSGFGSKGGGMGKMAMGGMKKGGGKRK